MVWAYFSNNKLGPIAFINGTINSHLYISILEAELIPFIQALQGDGLTDIVFQQDNARVHMSKLTTSWLTNSVIQNKFSTIEWPAYSSDMNPIEEFWAHLKMKVHRRYPDTKFLKGLSDAINKKIKERLWAVWWDIGEEILSSLIESMLAKTYVSYPYYSNKKVK